MVSASIRRSRTTAPARIPLARPSITSLETGYAGDAAANGWGEHCYDYLHRFEADFARHVGVQYAVATSSGTGALHLGMAALGIGPGDEVILADANWIASVAPIVHLGATPVFVDIDPSTWCLDPGAVASAITARTRAILAVHLYGSLCEIDELRQLGDRHGIVIIEDAAEAIGSLYGTARAGSMGVFGAFSFHGSKTISTGEGGMFVTKDPALYDTVLTLSNHGRSRRESRQFWPERVGFKFKMSNIQAALGCAQLERVDQLVARKREILREYQTRLGELPDITMNLEPDGTTIGAWMPTIVFSESSGVSADWMVRMFVENEIDGRPFFHPLSSLPMFGRGAGQPVAASIARRAVNLPSFHDMTSDQIERVAAAIVNALRSHV
jgi:perosamine synthetase